MTVDATMVDPWNACTHTPLSVEDPEIHALIAHEVERQQSGLELIASENFTSAAVMEANGSFLTNKYSEGLPGARYYGGNEFIDQVENLCRDRALTAFRLDAGQWGVNVQPYSGSAVWWRPYSCVALTDTYVTQRCVCTADAITPGSPANFAAYTALLQPHDRIMGLDLPSGGHLTHGYQTAKKKISATSIYFESMPYQVDHATGYIDYDALEKNALLFRPKLIICGASAYPRDYDYERLRKIADANSALLMCDMAHFSGLVAGGQVKSPFDLCDIVTTTTHKTLRGPRAGVIFFRKTDREGKPTDFESRINMAVFPGCQGGPHNHAIAGIAVAMKQAAQPSFVQYAKQVVANSRALGDALKSYGYKLATDGTDNHLILWDLRPLGLTGSKVERLCDEVHITVNKNAVHGDVSALNPGGVRLGTPALTSRSFKEADFTKVAALLHRTVQLALKAQQVAGSKLMKDFVAVLAENAEIKAELGALKTEVHALAKAFPMPGVVV